MLIPERLTECLENTLRLLYLENDWAARTHIKLLMDVAYRSGRRDEQIELEGRLRMEEFSAGDKICVAERDES